MDEVRMNIAVVIVIADCHGNGTAFAPTVKLLQTSVTQPTYRNGTRGTYIATVPRSFRAITCMLLCIVAVCAPHIFWATEQNHMATTDRQAQRPLRYVVPRVAQTRTLSRPYRLQGCAVLCPGTRWRAIGLRLRFLRVALMPQSITAIVQESAWMCSFQVREVHC